MKRIVALLLGVSMICSTFVGCGNKDADANKSGSGVLTVGIPQVMSVSDYDDNALTRYFEEKIWIIWKYYHSNIYITHSTSASYNCYMGIYRKMGLAISDSADLFLASC